MTLTTLNYKLAKFSPKTEMLTQNYKFGQIWSKIWNVRNVCEFWHSELMEYIILYKLIVI